MASPHYFIAIPVPFSFQSLFSTWQKQLREHVSYKQWPHQEDLHITLKFLGPVADTKIQSVTELLKPIEKINAFSVKVGNLGSFGNQINPRVLWAGVEVNKGLLELYNKVEEALSHVGFSKENRPYRPHITLAKKWTGVPFKTSIDELAEKFKEKYAFDVDHIVIYKIHPEKSPKYEEIAIFKLKRGDLAGSIN
ncbi:RNA 2',3'-cyclic phosphodiesterase [Virgibacillus halodenitrificans]|uniref:RNA 2',3'-cyclic phosphodiesterase n=1 Tax=Virgibacillus halodenitrificans TaxID=1482 RepID=UPI001F27D2CD|nr:RNA 2',3'-cyclic phosphodiesterase [Virgibacillus halodenitrificans]